jgi:hypothetical protein
MARQKGNAQAPNGNFSLTIDGCARPSDRSSNFTSKEQKKNEESPNRIRFMVATTTLTR